MNLSLNWLLAFVPAALAIRYIPALQNDTAVFVCSGLAIIPLAGWMGRATEELASKMGEGIGGLLNATFGNAAELIIGLMALAKGLTGVVKASITGSIIGNLLLVMGAAAFAGGLKFKEQRFNRTAAQVSSTSLLLAAAALLIPTVFHQTAAAQQKWSAQTEQHLSLAIAVVLFVTYLCALAFTLKTHKQLYAGSGRAEEEAGARWSRKKAVIILIISTVLIALMSELLVSTVEHTREVFGLTEVFVGVILVAVVGNAAEHSTAILTAVKNKMDLSLGIAVGSSLQIALFVAPVLVFASYLFGQPMDLEFTIPEIFAVIVAVVIVGQISADGETNWMEGVQLLSVYLILGLLFYFLPEHGSHPIGR